MNNYPEVVKQIHNEFNIAGERLLQESLSIIANSEKVDIEKAKRINELGFISNPLLKKALQIEEYIRPAATIVDTVVENRAKYPNNKFISYDDVNKICAKYNLVLGGVENYIGFIPEKNISDIELFLKNHPIDSKRTIIKGVEYYELPDVSVTSLFFPIVSFKKNSTIDFKERVSEFIRKYNSDPQQLKPVDYHGRRFGSSNNIVNHINRIILKDSPVLKVSNIIFESASPFMICAPEKDMSEKTITFQKVEVPDPVVLYPVPMGYIIITAWGDEASDELVINQNNN